MRKRVYNIRRQKNVDNTIKDIKKLVAGKKINEAKKALANAYQALDKAAKAGTIKKNAASRKKSRLSALIKRNS